MRFILVKRKAAEFEEWKEAITGNDKPLYRSGMEMFKVFRDASDHDQVICLCVVDEPDPPHEPDNTFFTGESFFPPEN